MTGSTLVSLSEASGKAVRDKLNNWEEAYRNGTRIKTSDYELKLHTLKPFEPVKILDYKVYPMKAHHVNCLEPLIYAVEKDGHSFLWGHDTGEFHTSTKDYLKELDLTFDFISLDCNLGRGERITDSHMDIDQCADTVEMLRNMGRIDNHTQVYISHIGHLHHHNHEEIDAEAHSLGMCAAYDGLEIEF